VRIFANSPMSSSSTELYKFYPHAPSNYPQLASQTSWGKGKNSSKVCRLRVSSFRWKLLACRQMYACVRAFVLIVGGCLTTLSSSPKRIESIPSQNIPCSSGHTLLHAELPPTLYRQHNKHTRIIGCFASNISASQKWMQSTHFSFQDISKP
jgi:hypothetical protein